MDEVNFSGAQLKLDVLSQTHMSSVLYNDCACENVACGRCICLPKQGARPRTAPPELGLTHLSRPRLNQFEKVSDAIARA